MGMTKVVANIRKESAEAAQALLAVGMAFVFGPIWAAGDVARTIYECRKEVESALESLEDVVASTTALAQAIAKTWDWNHEPEPDKPEPDKPEPEDE